MIVHIFYADMYHLTPRISRGFGTKYKNFEHKFILFGNKILDRKKYIELYSSIEFDNYLFCSNLFEFLKIIRKYKNDVVLFHGGKYKWHFTSLFAGVKNINWVCWGGGTVVSKSSSYKWKLFTPFMRYIYSKYQTIAVLMEEDRIGLAENFNVNEAKIFLVPYSSSDPNINKNLYLSLLESNNKETLDLNGQTKNKTKPLILLGNNSGNIKGYIELLDQLKMYAGKIRVQCMLHYSVTKNDTYDTLIELGNKLYGSDFRSNEEFYDRGKDYIKYMNTCDVYICNAENQRGLGAIYTTLSLGKKIYLTGKNYSWIKSLNTIIYNVEMINDELVFDDFIKPLKYDEQLINNGAILELRKKSEKRWFDYLTLLSHSTQKI